MADMYRIDEQQISMVRTVNNRKALLARLKAAIPQGPNDELFIACLDELFYELAPIAGMPNETNRMAAERGIIG